jgi:hypothetical protein
MADAAARWLPLLRRLGLWLSLRYVRPLSATALVGAWDITAALRPRMVVGQHRLGGDGACGAARPLWQSRRVLALARGPLGGLQVSSEANNPSSPLMFPILLVLNRLRCWRGCRSGQR